MGVPRPAPAAPARVTFIACRSDIRAHELLSQRRVAERLAALLDCEFVEMRAEPAAPTGPIGYAVPNETLDSLARAHALGIHREADLFGGVVPYPFVATKVITHPLVGTRAVAPSGWSPAFAESVRDVVLPGFCAFSARDAHTAGRRLLKQGDVRLKLATGIGGSGQSIARTESDLDAQIAAIDAAELARHGIVIERNLSEVKTYSVGLLRVGGLQASYFGTQRLTPNRLGKQVYGGSSLTVARGGLDRLSVVTEDVGVQRAIRQATVYHVAALECFSGMFASRCNYDVAEGVDAAGRHWSGVLEQSWRMGGASGAEVAALQALADDPSRQIVRASTTELHRADVAVPGSAIVLFDGVDDHLGPIVKYAEVHGDERT